MFDIGQIENCERFDHTLSRDRFGFAKYLEGATVKTRFDVKIKSAECLRDKGCHKDTTKI